MMSTEAIADDIDSPRAYLSSAHGETLPASLFQLRSGIWTRDLLIDWLSIIAACATWRWIGSWWALLPTLFFIGSRQHSLGLLGHDALHYLAFKNRRWNDLMSSIFVTWPLFVVLDGGYRPWHFAHHRSLGTDADPEVGYYASVHSYSGRVTWQKICRMFVADILGFGIGDLLKFISAIAPTRRPLQFIGPFLLWSAVVGLAVSTHTEWIVLLWLGSLATGFWAVFRVRAWTEHADLPAVWRTGKANVHRFSAGWLCRYFFFPHNTHCHYEHHQWPRVPYYNLPAARTYRESREVTPLPRLFPWSEFDARRASTDNEVKS